MLLRDIIELVCAPVISDHQIAWLKELLHLYNRENLFPDHALIPKHHYLAHYGDLILKFGPLIRVWTLHFESKHSYCKSCARKLHNFKNLCKTLAERHQMLQTFMSAGSLFPSELMIESSISFHTELYHVGIQWAVAPFHFNCENTAVTHKVVYKGSLYKEGLFVVISESVERYWFGKLVFMLCHNANSVFCLVEVYSGLYDIDTGLYCLMPHLIDSQTQIKCVHIELLLDSFPLVGYRRDSHYLIALDHAHLPIMSTSVKHGSCQAFCDVFYIV